MKMPPTVKEIDVANKNVLVRVDLEDANEGSPRLKATQEIITYLLSQNAARVKVIGHDGDIGLATSLGVDVNWDLRRDPREKENSLEFAQELAVGFDIYINESFATSHRAHASIDALPKYMKSQGCPVAIGLRFAQELHMLSQVLTKEGKKVLVVGGTKVVDKNKYAVLLQSHFDAICRGGLLDGSPLRPDGLDITEQAIEEYKNTISSAQVIVAAGVMGKYEDENSQAGTKETLTAIANSSAFKMAGGGDIENAISKYNLRGSFDWISVGGGAMLEYLSSGVLVGLTALSDE